MIENQEAIESQLETIVREFCGASDGESIDLQHSVESMDSLDKLELVYRIEEKLGIKIENLDSIESFDALIRIAKKKLPTQ